MNWNGISVMVEGLSDRTWSNSYMMIDVSVP